ncbi:MAG: hypothetical protein WCI36_03485 [bacterium]
MHREMRSLNQSQVANIMSKTYSGPFLMLREVFLLNHLGKPSASATMHISDSNPFMQWHPHAFPGVMLIEMAQQLGFIIAYDMKITGRPFMSRVEFKMKKSVHNGDTVVAFTKLINHKRGFYFFESDIKKSDGTMIAELSFQGLSIP